MATALAVELAVGHPAPGALDVIVTDAPPGADVRLVLGEPGFGPCVPGLCLGITAPAVVGVLRADADGEATRRVEAAVPEGRALQAVVGPPWSGSWPVALTDGEDACMAAVADAVRDVLVATWSDPVLVDDIEEGGREVWCFLDDYYALRGVVLLPTVTDTDVEVGPGFVTVSVSGTVAINEPVEPLSFEFDMACFEDTCSGWREPAAFTQTWTIWATPAEPLGWDVEATTDLEIDSAELVFSDCSLGEIDDVLGLYGISLSDLVDDVVVAAIDDLGASAGDAIAEEAAGLLEGVCPL